MRYVSSFPAIALFVCFEAFGQPQDVTSASTTRFDEATEQLRIETEQLVSMAILILESEGSSLESERLKTAAISFLGRVKSNRANKWLLANIDFRPSVVSMTMGRGPYRQMFPAVEATISIGVDCVPQVFNELASTQSKRRLSLFAYLLGEIYRDTALAEQKIQMERDKIVETTIKLRNLNSLIMLIRDPDLGSWDRVYHGGR